MIEYVDDIYKIIRECQASREELLKYFPDFGTCEGYSRYEYANRSTDEKVELCTADGYLSLDTFTYNTNQPIDSFGI